MATQPSLFDDLPPVTPGPALVAIAGSRAALSKAQTTFNQLIERIERRRQLLAHWRAGAERLIQRQQTEMLPLAAEVTQAQAALALKIHAILSGPPRAGEKLGRKQREKLIDLINELIEEVLEVGPRADIEAIHDLYGEMSLDDKRELEMSLAESMMSSLLGKKAVRGHDAKTAEDLLEQLAPQLRQAQQQAEEQQVERERKLADKRAAKQAAKRAAGGDAAHAAAPAQSSKAQAAKEASQSVRDVYRKLVSALHPDRASDSADQARRTGQMQRANQAYEAQDLLSLLSLQIEIEQIDANHLEGISDARLAHYNQVLREQLAQLEAEVLQWIEPFVVSTAYVDLKNPPTPEGAEQSYEETLAALREQRDQLRHDVVQFDDPVYLRGFLKDLRVSDAFDPFAGLADLGPSFSAAWPRQVPSRPGPRQRRRRQ